MKGAEIMLDGNIIGVPFIILEGDNLAHENKWHTLFRHKTHRHAL